MTITVPVTNGFGGPLIGEMTIDETMMPPTPEFVFSLGYRVIEAKGLKVVQYELLSVALLPDTLYVKFLESQGLRELR